MDDFCIMTDSLSVLSALKKQDESFRKHYILNDIKDLINILRIMGVRVNLMWTPSHIRIDGNDKADTLAKKGLENPDEEIHVTPHLLEIYSDLQLNMYHKWKSRFFLSKFSFSKCQNFPISEGFQKS